MKTFDEDELRQAIALVRAGRYERRAVELLADFAEEFIKIETLKEEL